jgi:hypothetical protein
MFAPLNSCHREQRSDVATLWRTLFSFATVLLRHSVPRSDIQSIFAPEAFTTAAPLGH